MVGIGKIIANNAGSNTLARIVAPGAIGLRNYEKGDALTASNANDPGYAFHQSQAQKDAAIYAAGAPQRAADAALSTANDSLAALRQRRRAGSAIPTGGTSGGGSLSTIMAYGKSTLG